MISTFATTFWGTAVPIAGIFLVMLAAGILVRRDVITQNQISGLSTATVTIFLPCFIFAKVVQTFDPSGLPLWWMLPISGIAMAVGGIAIGAIAFARKLPARWDMTAVAGVQNAGYLVLPIGLALFPNRFDEFALYVFLFILGYNPVLWSLGKILVSGRKRDEPLWRALLTPPVLANFAAVAVVLAGGRDSVPGVVLAPIDLLGTAAVPVATLVLGAVLGSIKVRFRAHLADALRAAAVKLLVLPILVITIVKLLDLHAVNPLLAEFFVIEAAAAPAVALVLQVRTYGGDEQRVGTAMFLSYLACMATLPAWVAVWRLLVA
jgi:hypothetical protein